LEETVKTFSPLISLALLLAASPSFAGTPGFNLSWSGCDTSPASTDRSYACDGRLGSPVVLEVSFRSDRTFPDFAEVEARIDFAWNTLSVPDFWRFDQTGCNHAMVSLLGPSTSSPCASPGLFDPDYSAGQMFLEFPTANRTRLVVEYATGAPAPRTMVAGALYGAFRLSIDVDQGVLSGCAGCERATVITLGSLALWGYAASEYCLITVPDANDTVTWQAQGPTPARNATWGAVKALYR
jgi:hypothetical protein